MKKYFLVCILLPCFTALPSKYLHHVETSDSVGAAPGRIFGGSLARDGEYPFYMRMVNKNLPTHTRCGASLIGNYFALTAAHCIVNTTVHILQAGSVDVTNTEKSKLYEIAETHTHPRFNIKNAQYDIQLLCLDVSVAFTPNIKPINIPDISEDFTNKPVVVVGSGATNGPKESTLVRKLYNTIVSIEECQKGWSKRRELLKKDIHYCTKDLPTDGVCVGDSGGPLVHTSGESHYLVGIASFTSLPSGRSNKSDVFANIRQFSGTFDKIMKNYVAKKS